MLYLVIHQDGTVSLDDTAPNSADVRFVPLELAAALETAKLILDLLVLASDRIATALDSLAGAPINLGQWEGRRVLEVLP